MHKDKFIVTEWDREQWGLWMLFGEDYRCILPVLDGRVVRGSLTNRERLVALAGELNTAWHLNDLKPGPTQSYYVHDAKLPRAASVGRVFVYAVKKHPGDEVISVFRTRERAEKVRDALNTALYAGDWISVDDRLPNENKKVLCSDLCQTYIGFLAEGKWYRVICDAPCEKVSKPYLITHWRPLPEPPIRDGMDYPVRFNEDVPDNTITITDGKYKVTITNIGKEKE